MSRPPFEVEVTETFWINQDGTPTSEAGQRCRMTAGLRLTVDPGCDLFYNYSVQRCQPEFYEVIKGRTRLVNPPAKPTKARKTAPPQP